MSTEIVQDDIKYLRSLTSAGFVDCKNALKNANGNINNAVKYLQKKGLVSAAKKLSRVTTEGLIESYIHFDYKVGVIIELNCETDFVSKKDEFHKLARDIAMQLAACKSIEYINIQDIPAEIIEQERKIEAEKEDLLNKDADRKEKIIEGRVQKRLKELSLMTQTFVKDNNISIDELIKQHIALFKENIRIRRFYRFVLGEGIEKKVNNFAEEVNNIKNL